MRHQFTILIVMIFKLFSSEKVHADAPFFWGVANSSFQVEGSPAPSDWSRWTHTPGKIKDGTNADVATDFINQYKKDFGLAQELGVNSFRISIAWERVQPAKDQWNLDALKMYEQILLDMRSHGIEPFITLHHFVLPKWLADEGGVLSKNFSKYFTNYAVKVFEVLARGPAKVSYWVTFNEAAVLALQGYLMGEWPPGIVGDTKKYKAAIAATVKAHNECVQKLRQEFKDVNFKIGAVHNWTELQPLDSSRFLDRIATGYANSHANRAFLNGVTKAGTMDFIGVNYYTRNMVQFTSKSPYVNVLPGAGPKSDIGWEIYPEGLGHVIDILKEYELPILVTENGIADESDQFRAQFIKDHVAILLEKRRQGVSIMGYMHWTLTDNFEWAFGLKPRFGLVEVDYGTQERRPRPSFEVYKNIIRANRDLRSVQ